MKIGRCQHEIIFDRNQISYLEELEFTKRYQTQPGQSSWHLTRGLRNVRESQISDYYIRVKTQKETCHTWLRLASVELLQ